MWYELLLRFLQATAASYMFFDKKKFIFGEDAVMLTAFELICEEVCSYFLWDCNS